MSKDNLRGSQINFKFTTSALIILDGPSNSDVTVGREYSLGFIETSGKSKFLFTFAWVFNISL